MNKPLISVILTTFNWSKFVKSAIESVLNQSYANLEFIIINDASTDLEVENIILLFKNKDSRIVYIKNEINIERSSSKNKWVGISKGQYIAFIDDDDIWFDIYKLEKQTKLIQEKPKVGLIWTNAICINEEKKEIWKIILKKDDKSIRDNILLTNQFIQSSVLIKKDVFLSIWGFNEKMNLCEDYDLWLRAWKLTKMANLEDFCIQYMIRSTNTTNKNQKIIYNAVCSHIVPEDWRVEPLNKNIIFVNAEI